LPAKVKTRWNAVRDPAAFAASAKRARNALESVERRARETKSGKATVEAEKARAASAAAAAPSAPYASTRQAAFHALLNTYADVTFPDRAPLGEEERDEMMDAYLLHAVAHVTRTRGRITKHNEALLRRAKAEEAARDAKKSEERERRARLETDGDDGSSEKNPKKKSSDPTSDPKPTRFGSSAPRLSRKRVTVQDDVPRDQGFARATVLILVPMRNVAGRVVRRLLELCPAAHGRADAVSRLERLADDFGDAAAEAAEAAAETARRRKKNLWVPEDHSAMFRGNTDDHFRLGIKVTKASVRLFVDFFGSDILIASPLGTSRANDDELPVSFSSRGGFWILDFRLFPFTGGSFFAGDENFTTLNTSYRRGVAELRVPYWPEARERNDDDARDATHATHTTRHAAFLRRRTRRDFETDDSFTRPFTRSLAPSRLPPFRPTRTTTKIKASPRSSRRVARARQTSSLPSRCSSWTTRT
jgi:hypothetical protein